MIAPGPETDALVAKAMGWLALGEGERVTWSHANRPGYRIGQAPYAYSTDESLEPEMIEWLLRHGCFLGHVERGDGIALCELVLKTVAVA